jgi:hypothetical protein
MLTAEEDTAAAAVTSRLMIRSSHAGCCITSGSRTEAPVTEQREPVVCPARRHVWYTICRRLRRHLVSRPTARLSPVSIEAMYGQRRPARHSRVSWPHTTRSWNAVLPELSTAIQRRRTLRRSSPGHCSRRCRRRCGGRQEQAPAGRYRQSFQPPTTVPTPTAPPAHTTLVPRRRAASKTETEYRSCGTRPKMVLLCEPYRLTGA